MTNQETVLVLDFGSRYQQLLTRKVRELGVYSELRSHKVTAEEIKAMQPKGIILAGGTDTIGFTYDERIFDLDIPVLAIGQAMALMVEKFAGNLTQAEPISYEQATINVNKQTTLFRNMHGTQEVLVPRGQI